MAKETAPLDRVASLEGSRAEYLAMVSAKDADAAIAFVVKDRAITGPEQVKRLAARPTPIA